MTDTPKGPPTMSMDEVYAQHDQKSAAALAAKTQPAEPGPLGVTEPPKPEPVEKAKSKLPKDLLDAGVTQDQIDKWKAEYGQLQLSRIANTLFIFRAITYAEWTAIQREAVTNDAMNNACIKTSQLWGGRVDGDPAGLIDGKCNAIANISQVNQGWLISIDDDVTKNWDELMKDYKKSRRIDRALLEAALDRHPDVWLFGTADIPFLMTSIDKNTYDGIIENDEVGKTDIRMVQEAVVVPENLSTKLIEALPYGIVLSLRNQLMKTSGFEPESTIIL